MRYFLCISLLIAYCGVSAFDALVELEAEVPKRVDVQIKKMFSKVRLNEELYEHDLVIPEGICVDLVSNSAGAIEVYLTTPFDQDFVLVGEKGNQLSFYLIDRKSGNRVDSGDLIYSQGAIEKPIVEELFFDLVIPKIGPQVGFDKEMKGQIGVNIRDI